MGFPKKAEEVASLKADIGKHVACRIRDLTYDPENKKIYAVHSDAPNPDIGSLIAVFSVTQVGTELKCTKLEEKFEAHRVGGVCMISKNEMVITFMKKPTNWVKNPLWEAAIFKDKFTDPVSLDVSKISQPCRDDSWLMAFHGGRLVVATPEDTKLHYFKAGETTPCHVTKMPKLAGVERLRFFHNGILCVTNRHQGGHRFPPAGKTNKYDLTMYKISPPTPEFPDWDDVKEVGKVKDVSRGQYGILSNDHILFGRFNLLWKKLEFLAIDWHKPDDFQTCDTKIQNPEPLAFVNEGNLLASIDDGKNKKFSLLRLIY